MHRKDSGDAVRLQHKEQGRVADELPGPRACEQTCGPLAIVSVRFSLPTTGGQSYDIIGICHRDILNTLNHQSARAKVPWSPPLPVLSCIQPSSVPPFKKTLRPAKCCFPSIFTWRQSGWVLSPFPTPSIPIYLPP